MLARIRGFTLLEMIVVIAIILSLAGILVPVVHSELEDKKTATAEEAIGQIATAIAQYMKDSQYAPTGTDGKKTYHYLFGVGTPPKLNVFASGEGAALETFLTTNAVGNSNWRGPYLQEIGADPWGCSYVVNTHGFFDLHERVWILSAGPNREVETRPTDSIAGGDDIGIFIQ